MMNTNPNPAEPAAKVLIAEDSATQAERLAHILRRQGYEVAIAANGRIALEMARGFGPALIISDVVMPEIDGYELSSRVKADPGLRAIPVILVTTMSDPEDVIRGLQCGADNFILKPYADKYLLDRVRYVLLNRQLLRESSVGMGVEIFFHGKQHYITADRLQILNLLLSTYEATVQRNRELGHNQEALQRTNARLNELAAELEGRVAERTRELARSNEALRESEARIRLIVDTALDGVTTMDASGIIRDWNAQAEAIFGWSREQALGRSVAELIVPPRYRDAHARGLERFLATGDGPLLNRRVEITGLRRDGAEFPLELSIAPMKVKGEWLFSAFARDITERKQAEEQARRMNEELEQRVRDRTAELESANRAKGVFLATMSHEIRTPMNGVLGMLELLGMTSLDAEQRATLDIVRESGMSLLRIIDDILDFSKIEAGKLEVRPEPASVERIVRQTVKIFAGNASAKGLRLAARVDARIGPALRVDPVRVQQILNNFVSNAIKFTASGGIEIVAELVERQGNEELLRFSVSDSGIGISAADQQRLFQPFSQIAGRTANEFGGTGLGLSICRRLATMMGGSVEMASEPGAGTTMTLTLRAKIADGQQPSSQAVARASAGAVRDNRRKAPSVAEGEAEGKLVLVVDDHPINCMVLLRQVNALGYAAETADNGRSALTKLESGRFALMVTDCNMPEMDGYELARTFRRMEAERGLKRTPIIACTANAMAGEAEACLAAGMDDYIAKPVELRELMVKLDRWLPIPAQPPDEGNARSTR